MFTIVHIYPQTTEKQNNNQNRRKTCIFRKNKGINWKIGQYVYIVMRILHIFVYYVYYCSSYFAVYKMIYSFNDSRNDVMLNDGRLKILTITKGSQPIAYKLGDAC